MFDTELIDRPSDVPAPFSSENPPPEVRTYTTSDCVAFWHCIFLSCEPRGPFPKSSQVLFYPTIMMKLPIHRSLMRRSIRRCQLPMTLEMWELLQLRHSFLARFRLVCVVTPGPLSPIWSPLYHLQAVVAKNGYTFR
jgi:hypothetical protein